MTSRLNDLVEVIGLVKIYQEPSFKRKVAVLKGLDFKIKEKTISIFMGPSGSGKTTLLRILLGTLVPSAGQVIIDTKDIYELRQSEIIKFRKENIGYIPQEPRSMFIENLTVLDNVLLSLAIANKQANLDRIEDVFSKLNITELLSRRPNTLSGGEVQRASFGLAIIKNPDILIADEPTSELDGASALQLIKLIQLIVEEFNITMIIATHDNRFRKISDNLFVLENGHLRELGGR